MGVFTIVASAPGQSQFWGAVFALPAGAAAAAATAAVVGRSAAVKRAARYGLAFVLLAWGAVVTWWNLLWNVTLTSLEGAWLWPLAGVPLVSSVLVLRAVRRCGGARR